MRNTGYRIYSKPQWILQFVKKYASFFKAIEINSDYTFMNDVYLKAFVKFCEDEGMKDLFFHLPSTTLTNENQCGNACDFMMEYDNSYPISMITNYYGNSGESDFYSYAIAKAAEGRSITVLLENASLSKNLIAYFESLKECAARNKFKICLNIGNLLHSLIKSNELVGLLYSYFMKDPWWKENIAAIHIIDYNVGKRNYPANLGQGLLYKHIKYVRKFLECVNDDVPIILETYIQDIETQGVIEMEEFFNKLYPPEN